MVTTGSEDAWQIRAAISIDDGTNHMVLQVITEDIEADLSERELDKIDLLDDNQIPKHGGLGVATITFKGYPLYAGTKIKGIAEGYWDIFAEKPTMDNAQPLANVISNTRTRYRVAFLVTNESIQTGTASGLTDTALTDAGIGWTASDYIARMLVFTSGSTSGRSYVITANGTDTLTCSGATMSADGAGATETYKIIHTGTGLIQAASKAKRLVMADMTCISCKVNTFSANEPWSMTMIFKVNALDKSGNGNIKKESHDGTGAVDLPKLADYVAGTTKW